MSCLDVLYQIYGPSQPYFAGAYSPYHQVRVVDSGEEAEGGRGIVWRMAIWGLTKGKKGKGEGEGKGGAGGGEIWEPAMVSGAEPHPTSARGSAEYVRRRQTTDYAMLLERGDDFNPQKDF